jgi:hypothetical protein
MTFRSRTFKTYLFIQLTYGAAPNSPVVCITRNGIEMIQNVDFEEITAVLSYFKYLDYILHFYVRFLSHINYTV